MARKSKYKHQSSSGGTKQWRPALYLRLSREDGDREESDSIQNQRDLLTEFASSQPDMTEPKLYLDDGFNRHGF